MSYPHPSSIVTLLCAVWVLRETFEWVRGTWWNLRQGKDRIAALRAGHRVLLHLQETLQSGDLPSQELWAKLEILPAPWQSTCVEILVTLRKEGCQVLPTLRRLSDLIQHEANRLEQARAKTALAWTQALTLSLVIPLLSVLLYLLIPEIQERAELWCGLTSIALLLAGLGVAWILNLCDTAAWAGLSGMHRSLWAESFLGVERILAKIHSGQPADIAWKNAVLSSPTLLQETWGPMLWVPQPERDLGSARTLQRIYLFGIHLKKSIQQSVMEGHGLQLRIEAAAETLRQELTNHLNRELEALPAKTLKPLFLCIAPACLGILVAGISILISSSAPHSFTSLSGSS